MKLEELWTLSVQNATAEGLTPSRILATFHADSVEEAKAKAAPFVTAEAGTFEMEEWWHALDADEWYSSAWDRRGPHFALTYGNP